MLTCICGKCSRCIYQDQQRRNRERYGRPDYPGVEEAARIDQERRDEPR